MRTFLVALVIDPVEPGRTYDHLPLHCTAVDWCFLNPPHDSIEGAVRPILEASSPIELVGGPSDLFGPTSGPRDLPVTLIRESPPLRLLHEMLLDALDSLGALPSEPAYTRSGFNFHVTQQGSARFGKDRIHLATTAFVAEALDPVRIARKLIRAKINLGGA
jgi:hypothetical protein